MHEGAALSTLFPSRNDAQPRRLEAAWSERNPHPFRALCLDGLPYSRCVVGLETIHDDDFARKQRGTKLVGDEAQEVHSSLWSCAIGPWSVSAATMVTLFLPQLAGLYCTA